MRACMNGHIDIARMLVGEYNANIDIADTVRVIVIEYTWKLDSWMGWGIDAAIRIFVRNIVMKKHFLHESEYIMTISCLGTIRSYEPIIGRP